MSDDEDDYLSDKFLAQAAASSSSSSGKTYAERRKEAQRVAAIKNEQNKKKSRRQLEQEAREEGLSKSLFERAQEEQGEADAPKNKALAMMMKMGFKPGQSLGHIEADQGKELSPSHFHTPEDATDAPEFRKGSLAAEPKPTLKSHHRTVPLPLTEWAGKKGIGLGSKRAASPSASERIAKMAKMADERDHVDFRDRARQEYEERRAEGRLVPAQLTCTTLDEKAGREFNILWLNPSNPEAFPEGLVDSLDDPEVILALKRQQQRRDTSTIEGRLRARMQADALQPISSLEDDEATDTTKVDLVKTPYSEDDIKEAAQFLRLSAKDRLELVLDYLRRRYAYCFWCGTEYQDQDDMAQNCPGPDEEAHD